MENSKIAWTDHTFNPWIGCTKVHTGCKNCYAEELMANRYKRVKWGPQGERSITKTWNDPIRWNKEASSKGIRYRVFCASLADVFEDKEEVADWRKNLFKLIDNTPCLDWLLLTKRPENIQGMWGGFTYKKNVWLGTSPCDQGTAEGSIPKLLHSRELCPVLFLSAEPLVGNIDFTKLLAGINWVIFGGESGPNARPCNVNWIRQGVITCKANAVKVFVKQLGSNPVCGCSTNADVIENKCVNCGFKYPTDRKADNVEEWPQDLIVREFPHGC